MDWEAVETFCRLRGGAMVNENLARTTSSKGLFTASKHLTFDLVSSAN